ncbi:hypothetical protein [Thiomicrospira sp. WB1]|jgi:methyl-accepting chemotaxis protein|uniref:hypothetical protein n=1 Tax=Thiomicrospira sp. WB1 TaxID=1685380 RepID=UPI00074A3118|nr:hypothetical protein [Thiomicrospira sp. WB1]KUJ71569.1 hypothetical protein AVO41_08620 [Thiomicrospira sp. WB1]
MSFALGAKEVQETILMLNLSVAQIELSINEGDHSVNTLIDSFTYMSQHLEAIEQSSQKIAHLSDQVDGMAEHNASLLSQTSELSEKMHQAIIAFQFYDKLSQRLNHVSVGLSGLAEIVSHEMHAKDQAQWESFRQAVRKGTSMQEEEELFELIFDKKCPVDEAIETMKGRMRERLKHPVEPEEDPIELF